MESYWKPNWIHYLFNKDTSGRQWVSLFNKIGGNWIPKKDFYIYSIIIREKIFSQKNKTKKNKTKKDKGSRLMERSFKEINPLRNLFCFFDFFVWL